MCLFTSSHPLKSRMSMFRCIVSANILIFPRELNTVVKLLYTSARFLSLYWSRIVMGGSSRFLWRFTMLWNLCTNSRNIVLDVVLIR